MSRRADNVTEPSDLGPTRLEDLMRRAITLATAHRPHPNPRVGAVVLDAEGRVVGEAAHVAAGEAHAEAAALMLAGERARGGTVIVTLEPCDHHGRTPPCTEAILAAGIARVVVGHADPDTRVDGKGIERLRDAGVEVLTGVLAEDVEAADPGYYHHRRTGLPRVTLKLATTLDGQTAAADGTSQWITSEAARADVHRLRAESDAVVVGAGTLRTDDPRLDVRLDGFEGPQPLPVIVAGRQPLPDAARIYQRAPLIYAPTRDVVPRGAAGEVVTAWTAAGVDLEAMIKDLSRRGILDVLVEGGPTLAGALLRAGLVDHVVWYLGGKLAGGAGMPAFAGAWATLDEAVGLDIIDVRRLGADVRIDARVASDETQGEVH